jgi:hypothetical protein
MNCEYVQTNECAVLLTRSPPPAPAAARTRGFFCGCASRLRSIRACGTVGDSLTLEILLSIYISRCFCL